MGHHGTRISLKPFIFNIYRTSWDGIKQEFGALSVHKNINIRYCFYIIYFLYHKFVPLNIPLKQKMLWVLVPNLKAQNIRMSFRKTPSAMISN